MLAGGSLRPTPAPHFLAPNHSVLPLRLPSLQEFSPSPPGLGHTITMGEFARDILLDQVGVGGG